MLDHLPRDGKSLLPNASVCPAYSGGRRQLGEDVAEQLKYIPACFRVFRHVPPKMALSVAPVPC